MQVHDPQGSLSGEPLPPSFKIAQCYGLNHIQGEKLARR